MCEHKHWILMLITHPILSENILDFGDKLHTVLAFLLPGKQENSSQPKQKYRFLFHFAQRILWIKIIYELTDLIAIEYAGFQFVMLLILEKAWQKWMK